MGEWVGFFMVDLASLLLYMQIVYINNATKFCFREGRCAIIFGLISLRHESYTFPARSLFVFFMFDGKTLPVFQRLSRFKLCKGGFLPGTYLPHGLQSHAEAFRGNRQRCALALHWPLPSNGR